MNNNLRNSTEEEKILRMPIVEIDIVNIQRRESVNAMKHCGEITISTTSDTSSLIKSNNKRSAGLEIEFEYENQGASKYFSIDPTFASSLNIGDELEFEENDFNMSSKESLSIPWNGMILNYWNLGEFMESFRKVFPTHFQMLIRITRKVIVNQGTLLVLYAKIVHPLH